MKIRTGFVSNSSSSSFIVIFKSGQKCPTCGMSPSNCIEDLPEETWDADGTYLEKKGAKDIASDWEEDIDDECCEEEQVKEIKAMITKLHQAEKDGYTVYRINVSYSDGCLQNMIEKDPNIEIVWSLN